MRADDELRSTARDVILRLALGGGAEAAGQPGRPDPERREPVRDAAEVLLREQLGGCHQGGLPAGLDGTRGRERGHDGLAAAHIPLDQALHRMFACQVVLDLVPDTTLRLGQLERQRRQQACRQPVRPQHRRAPLLPRRTRQAQRDLLRHQFVELQSMPGRVRAIGERSRIGVRRRMVQALECGTQWLEAVTLAQRVGQQVA